MQEPSAPRRPRRAPSPPASVPGGRARIYLVRHGRTHLNAAGALRGRLDPPLDEAGMQEVQRLAVALSDRAAVLVVASPLRRAVETAGEVARAVGLEVELDARLIDRDYGQWAGLRQTEVERRFGSLDLAPGVEPPGAVSARALAALEAMADRLEGAAGVAVSHEAVIRAALHALAGGSAGAEGVDLRTGHVSTLEREARRWVVLGLDEDPARTSLP